VVLVLRGRRGECQALDLLVEGVRAGRSSVLVVRGEAGSGKTALLEYVRDRASGCRIARAGGVESEMELPFAGLHQLCTPMLRPMQRLPAPQRDALRVVFGLSSGEAPGRFLVGLAVLGLLSEVAEERPLVCLVDDTQWLDRASTQALAFVARRLLAEPVALVFAVREPGDERDLIDLPELVVPGLGDSDARHLLESVAPGRLDEPVRDRIVAETRGNPLALLELPRGLTPAELAGGFGLPDPMALSGRIEESFRRRLQSLPVPTQRLLVVAAAEPVGDAALLWRAADRLGIGRDAAAPAQGAGLIDIGARVRFHHPLVRSAAYRGASPHARQEVHRVLAAATDPQVDPDRRAWHRAHAAAGPDEEVAVELERSASRAQSRGGVAAAAAFLERATELTPDPARRGARALAAASAKLEAGAPDTAYELLATAELGPLDELQRARLERLRAQIVFALRRGSDAPPLLLDAAKRLIPLDAGLARETYLDALGAAIFAGRLGGGRGIRETAEAARAAPPAPQPPRAIDLLLDGLVTRFTDGYAAGVPSLRQALRALCRQDGGTGDDLRWLWLACRVAADVWDDETWHELAGRQVQLAREAGALTVLAVAVTYRAGVHVHAGEFAAASALNDEADAITQATGSAPLRYTSPVLAAWRGQEARTAELIESGVRDATARGEGRAITIADYVTAVLDNGLGRYDAAFVAAGRACEHDELNLLGWALIELVEAGARSGRPEVADDALRRLGERTRTCGTDWARGIEARSRALVSEGRAAEDLYREAIERLARTRIAVHRARAELLYGEWLRREGRRLDAREQLRRAYDMFSRIGADAFAGRARHELLATGETVRKRTVETLQELTAQEAQIARLARDGQTNPEIGARLFISPRTVEWHLRNVFSKLEISSRKELHSVLPEIGRAGLPA
jgi:DNA-binding CsgD family transcriptional regulator